MKDQALIDWLTDLWERSRKQDLVALDELLNFLVTKGRKMLTPYLRDGAKRRTNSTREIFQLAAMKLLEKAKEGTLKEPKGDVWNTIKSFLWKTKQEVIRSKKMTPRSREYPESLDVHQRRASKTRISKERHISEEALRDKAKIDPTRDLPEIWNRMIDLDRLYGAVSKIHGKDGEIARLYLAKVPEREIADKVGLSYPALRQRIHRIANRLLRAI